MSLLFSFWSVVRTHSAWVSWDLRYMHFLMRCALISQVDFVRLSCTQIPFALSFLLLFSCYVMFDSRDPMDCNPSGFSVHGISQARILEWVAISFSRESLQPRDWTCASCLEQIALQPCFMLSFLIASKMPLQQKWLIQLLASRNKNNFFLQPDRFDIKESILKFIHAYILHKVSNWQVLTNL